MKTKKGEEVEAKDNECLDIDKRLARISEVWLSMSNHYAYEIKGHLNKILDSYQRDKDGILLGIALYEIRDAIYKQCEKQDELFRGICDLRKEYDMLKNSNNKKGTEE